MSDQEMALPILETLILACTALVLIIILLQCGGCKQGSSERRKGGGGHSFRWISGAESGDGGSGIFESADIEGGGGDGLDGGERANV